MLSSYYAFNIASILMFIVISILQGEALREMYEDPHVSDTVRRQAAGEILTGTLFGLATSILQAFGCIMSRELIKCHLVYDFSSLERTAFISAMENRIHQNQHRRREHQVGLPEEYITALPTETLPSDWKAGVDENALCVICQDDHQPGDVIKSLPCGHKFHSKCIDEWLHRSGSCPMCNQNVIETAARPSTGVVNNHPSSTTNNRNDDSSPPVADVLSITILPANDMQNSSMTMTSSSNQVIPMTSSVSSTSKESSQPSASEVKHSQDLARHMP